jgi:hypothetical protein
MWKVILIVLVVLTGALGSVIAVRPAEYRVVRSATINAPPQSVFSLVNDFHKWDAWSPWAKLDPNMRVTHDGPQAGTGAVYTWSGNKDVGEGRMTIVESKPAELVRIKLDFLKPFASSSSNEFSFKPDGAGTRVDWTMAGSNDFMGKAFDLFFGGMDKMVGPDFEKGLAQMKSVAESAR